MYFLYRLFFFLFTEFGIAKLNVSRVPAEHDPAG